MKKTALHTDHSYFARLEDYPFAAHYLHVSHPDYHPLKLHYVDEGAGPDKARASVLMLHGCPSWSYLYRHVIDYLLRSRGDQLRLIAPDHIGCGKSDKLLQRNDYSYDFYVATITSLIEQLDLRNIILLCQDWGGPIGLRALSEMPQRFAGVVACNTLLPNCQPAPLGIDDWPGGTIEQWVEMTRSAEDLPVGQIMQGVTCTELSPAVMAAYDAPFPGPEYKQGILNWPSLIPQSEDAAGIKENRHTWKLLEESDIPFLTAFSDQDPTTADWEVVFQQRIPAAKKQPHKKIIGAGHMAQEDQGEQLAKIIEEFIFG